MNVAWVVLVCYILCIKNLYAQPCLVLVSQIVFCNCFCSVNCIIIWELCMLDQVFLFKAYHTNISNHCICKVIQLLTLPEPLSWPSAIGPCPLSCSLYIVFANLWGKRTNDWGKNGAKNHVVQYLKCLYHMSEMFLSTSFHIRRN